jgi:tetratricopeptide (TPR) repeat protein
VDWETTEAPQLQILEQGKRLSECILWRLLENFYTEGGIEAWDDVPFYITNNRVIANAYAELTCHLLLDLLPVLDKTEPVYILEMAAGAGCFSYYFLERLFHKIAQFESLKALNVCFVMTDFSDTNFSSWESHPEFHAYQAVGKLDFAVFRPEDDLTLFLKFQQNTLSAENLKNPILAIGNYFFDSIKHDLFKVDNGQIQEASLTFFRELNGIATDAPLKLSQLKNLKQMINIEPNYYSDSEANAVLNQYAQPNDTFLFTIPIGAFNVLKNLQQLSNGKLLLLSSDKGFSDLSTLHNLGETLYTAHGDGFSMMVNYHAISQYFENAKGRFFCTKDTRFITSLGIMLPESMACDFSYTTHYFKEEISQKNSFLNYVNSFPLMDPKADREPNAAFHSICAFMEMHLYDPWTLYLASPQLILIYQQLTPLQIEKILQVMDKVEPHVYFVAHRPDIWVILGILYYYLQRFEKAQYALSRSEAIYGHTESMLYYRALSQEALREYEAALSTYQQLQQLNPECFLCKTSIERLQQNPILPFPQINPLSIPYFLKAFAADFM